MHAQTLAFPPRPALQVRVETRVCGESVADVTVGCTFGCVYCPFADSSLRRHGMSRPTVLDTSAVDGVPAPPKVYFSASSDAFAPQAAAQAHALLAEWLPQGTIVAIVTKGVIPERTIDLLAEFRGQVEGVSIGLASLDDRRNHSVEPGCPPAAARLAVIERLAARRVPVALRMDPLFPGLDDGDASVRPLVAEGEGRGASSIVAGYVFAWGRYLRRLRREPLLAEACRHLTARAPMAGGTGWSVPFARKLTLYTHLAELAHSHGMFFQTCGCKDLRLHAYANRFFTRCTENPYFRQELPTVAA